MKCKHGCSDEKCKNCYLEYRLNNQIEWYNFKSKFYKKVHTRIIMMTLIISCLLPALASTNFTLIFSSKTYLIILSIIDGILIASNKAFNFQELWVSYRMIYLSLEKEKINFIEKQNPYKQTLIDENLSYLVNRVEDLLDNQNSSWKKFTNRTTYTKKSISN